ncbi:MAG: glycosyltransferase family 4 protein [Patescibacteria group bacterium]
MKVIFQCRPNLYTLSGGDKIQIEHTNRELEKLGVTVEISTTNNPDLANVDIFHLFNPSLLSLEPVLLAKQNNIPVVISTIHWDMKEYYESMFSVNKEYFRLRPPHYLANYLKNQAYAMAYNYWWYRKNIRDIQKLFSLGDLLLPNSQAEIDHIKQYFSLPTQSFAAIPNGIAIKDTEISPDAFYNKFKLKDFILCAGRIEYRKNQHLLLEALQDTDMPIVFIGNNTFNAGYTSICQALATRRGNVHFIPHLSQPELYSAYLNARVHALVSWYETPGLANLEAGYLGCNLAVSDKGCTREYFGDHADYCDPKNLGSIKTAVLAAWHKPKNSSLREHIQKNYTWQQTGQATATAYRSLL